MSNTIQHKRSTTSGTTPSASDLAVGEIGINTADRTLFTKHSDGTVVPVADVASDETPQLGGTLDAGTNAIQYSTPAPGSQQTFLGLTASGGSTTPLVRTTHVATGSRNTELTFDNSGTATTKLATTNTGVSVAGDIAVTGTVDGKNVSSLLENVVEDTSPQLGGDLDTNSNHIYLDQQHYIKFDGNSYNFFMGYGYYDNAISSQYRNLSINVGNASTTRSVVIHNGVYTSGDKMAASFTPNGTQYLYNGNLEKIATAPYGIEVSGDTINGSGAIQLNCEYNTHGVKIKSPPHSAAASYTLTLPDNDGTNGQALTTDGSGNLSFTTISGGSALTIKDEGTALTTAATTLNFTGAGVTATGSGAEKTITISGGGGSGGSGVGEGKALVFANLFG